MRHSIHVMFGKDLQKLLLEFGHYIDKYGDSIISNYLTALYYSGNDANAVSIKRNVNGELVEEISFDDSNKTDILKNYIQKLWRQRINTDYAGYDPLHICLHIPLYDSQTWQQAYTFMCLAQEQLGPQRITIDIIGLCHDMAEILHSEKNEEFTCKTEILEQDVNSVIDAIVNLRKKETTIHYLSNFIVIQNETNLRALELTQESLARILAEFAMICVEHHDAVFGRNIDKKDIQTLGLSILSFDQFYFRKFLLQDSFIKLLDGEKIGEDDVNIAWAARQIDLLLHPWLNMMSTFYKEEVATRRERGDLLTDIIPDIQPRLQKKFEELNKQLTEHILGNESLSLPQKKGLLSVLLGQDDVLFLHGTLINSEQAILADLERECVNFFVNENNALLHHEQTKESIILPAFDKETETAKFPLDELKELRYKQRNYISNIREVEDELADLKRNLSQIDESRKCLIEDGKFIINDESFQLLDHDNDVVPLEETYKAHIVKSKNIDISDGFTEIKNQGAQGACMSFSMVSVFEYFLKQNHEDFPDLSEQFLYYNARKRRSNESKDNGSDSVNSILSLVEDGICSESLWPYDVTKYAVQPSNTAYEEAKIRKVKKAVMVEKDIESIKSALEDGLPVIFAAELFPSFGQNINGFISMPSEDEVAQLLQSRENHSHAMVFCGFNNAQCVFKVRNSWGTSFGDKGYCYLPYDYVMQYAYSDMVAIQEISVLKETKIDDEKSSESDVIFTIKKETRPQLNFSETDIAIRYVQREQFLYGLKRALKTLRSEDKVLQTYYEAVKIPILDRNKRDTFYQQCKLRREIEIEELEQQKIDNEEEKRDELKKYDKKTKTIASSVLSTFGSLATTFGVFDKLIGGVGGKFYNWINGLKDIFGIGSWVTHNIFGHNTYYIGSFFNFLLGENGNINNNKIHFFHGLFRFCWILFVVAFVVFCVAYFWYRLSHRKDIEIKYNKIRRDLNAAIKELEDQIDTLEARFLLAGDMLRHLFSLTTNMQTRHSAMSHYIINLRNWYDTTIVEHAAMQAKTHPPFVSLLRNDILEEYFTNQQDSLIDTNNLWQFVETYEPSEEGIVQVKKNIEEDLIKKIDGYLTNFSVADYIINLKDKDKYPYLIHDFDDICTLFNDLNRKSDMFIKYNIQDEGRDASQVMFVHTTDENQERKLENELKHATTDMEMRSISSRYKVVLVRKQELDRNQIIL